MGCSFANTEWHPIVQQNSYKKCTYIYIYINKHRASGREPRSSWGNTLSNPQVSALVPRPVVNGMERMCQRHWSDQTPTLLFETKNHVSINLYNIMYNDGTSASLQPVLRPTEGNPGSIAFPGAGEQLPRVNMDQANGMSCQARVQNG